MESKTLTSILQPSARRMYFVISNFERGALAPDVSSAMIGAVAVWVRPLLSVTLSSISRKPAGKLTLPGFWLVEVPGVPSLKFQSQLVMVAAGVRTYE